MLEPGLGWAASGCRDAALRGQHAGAKSRDFCIGPLTMLTGARAAGGGAATRGGARKVSLHCRGAVDGGR